MAEKGFVYATATVVPSLQDSRTNPSEWWFAPDVELSERVGFGFFSQSPGDFLPTITSDSGAYDAMTAGDRKIYDSTLSSCLDVVDQRVVFQGPLNPQASVLGGSLVNAFRVRMNDTDFTQIAEKYRHCMAAAGHRVSAPGATFDALQEDVAAAFLAICECKMALLQSLPNKRKTSFDKGFAKVEATTIEVTRDVPRQ